MAELLIRSYDVLFGDAILITVPERKGGHDTPRHILIDVGNIAGTKGGDDSVFEPIVDDILSVLGGKPIDLYVMTHEHLDHVQGLPYVATKKGKEIPVDYAWLTASAEPGYYDAHPDAKKQKVALDAVRDAVRAYLEVTPAALDDHTRALLANNDPRSTESCVDYLRKLAKKKTSYVHREKKQLEKTHPFEEAKLSVWGPEEDTSDYYGRFRPMALHAGSASPAKGLPAMPNPPPGVDTSAFYNLVARRANGWIDNLLQIDAAANNTSVVFCLEWRGWRLLFAGDAEVRSWKTMQARGALGPVDFLKVSHHGSHNGTPPDDILEAVLPGNAADNPDRVALVSTCEVGYSGVPDPATLRRLRKRCAVRSMIRDTKQGRIDIALPARV